MLFRIMLLFVCVQYTNIQFTLLFVLNARMNFRDYGNCANESPCSTIDCPQMLWFVSSLTIDVTFRVHECPKEL